MDRYAAFEALPIVAAALAVILSAVVSLIGTSARQRAVSEGRARASDLCELTGVFYPRQLQDIYGPPTLGGSWPTVTRDRIRRERRPPAYILSYDPFDYACMLAALSRLVFAHEITSLALILAVIGQSTGWLMSTRLPRPTG